VARLSAGKKGSTMKGKPDLRTGDPRVHDLVAEIDEAIDAGDEPRVEELSKKLRVLDPEAGAGSDT
jgi:hypothetical protein